MDLAAAGTLVYRFGVLACDMMRQEEDMIALCHGYTAYSGSAHVALGWKVDSTPPKIA